MRLAWFLTWRDMRQGGAMLLGMALVVSVTAVSAVGLLADRVRQALAQDAQSTLAADMVLVSDHPTPAQWTDSVSDRGFRSVRGSQFPSMAQTGKGDAARGLLAAVKTVTAGYPLRGNIEVQTAEGRKRNPELGLTEVWIDPALSSSLNVDIGDTLRLGLVEFRISGLLLQEPDRGMNFVNLSPRVMIRHERLADTQLVQPGSRISYRLWVAAQTPAGIAEVEAFADALAPTLGRGQRLETLENARPELRNALDRAYAFLSLTGMLASLTAAAAVALASQRFVTRHLQTCAVLKSLGATQARLAQWWALELLLITVAAVIVGMGLGWAVQAWLAQLASAYLSLPLSATSWRPFAQACGVAVAMVLGFAVPPLAELKKVPAVRVLRQDMPIYSVSGKIWVVLMLAAVWLLLWLGTGNLTLSLVTAVGFAIAGLAFSLLSWLLFRGLPAWQPTTSAATQSQPGVLRWAWQSTRRSLQRRGGALALQIQGVAMALTALFLLTTVQADLVKAWRLSTPPDAPNRFVLNIQTEQRFEVADAIRKAGLGNPTVSPMVRGRLIAINGRSIQPSDFTDDRAQRLVDREFNLTYSKTIPAHNRLVAGTPMDPDLKEVSVESGIAKTLGLALNDRIIFEVAGEPVEVTVKNLRALRWDSMEVNFFMILTPAALKEAPQSWITSLHVPEDASGRPSVDLTRQLLTRFPSLTVFDVSALVRQLQRILDQVISAVQMLFGFALASGVLVLWAALLSTRDARLREAAVFRALGASRRQLSAAQMMELALVGGVAGFLAAAASLAIGALLAERVFALALEPRWSALAIGAAVGASISLLAGWVALRPVLKTPAWQTLKEST
ncbi:MAG: FtsX-like permease family protein [Betaproteobacteria bacterium]|nr:FtsX-like permease family protein [Betaproteobacteria bacterium]